MTVKERIESQEKQILSQYATLSCNTKGRDVFEKACPLRTEFGRDRDRIIHSKAFRRLKHKTQVFITPEGDHYRTRLTHTLEVSQIARSIAVALQLNETLTEAIALGHDLGHTPFGHAGERALDRIYEGGFRHNEQSLRVVEKLEDMRGLNLTYEVRNGILNHSGDNIADTLEGQIVKFADRFAYINHDIDDAIRGGLLSYDDLPHELIDILGDTHSKRINTLILDIVSNSGQKISMSNDMYNTLMTLRKFMFENVYLGSRAIDEERKIKNVIESLFEFYQKNLNQLPSEEQTRLENEKADRVICDFIAGMTDRYALYEFKRIFIPNSWQIK